MSNTNTQSIVLSKHTHLSQCKKCLKKKFFKKQNIMTQHYDAKLLFNKHVFDNIRTFSEHTSPSFCLRWGMYH